MLRDRGPFLRATLRTLRHLRLETLSHKAPSQMCNFVQPGCLGTPKSFKLNFSDSIVRSRDKNCSEDEARVGRKRLKELNRRTAPLVLRRTQQHIAGEMPPKVMNAGSIFTEGETHMYIEKE